ncbi:mitochondrial uncoupling protein 1 [Gossypium australe]|uniref:Mitochondrial uncoupling protein 1 n=1 Tax=Gossypium australe TaxID=47621 RepID=A0A5B6V413_9ROSI|nr:mitochondrial uncoupling protein 1 [Gossypium australe]
MVADQKGKSDISFAGTFASSAFAACFAEICTIPLDTAKVRLQLQKKALGGDAAALPKYRGLLGTVGTIAREEGLAALWKGVIPGLHRQCLFGGLRIGMYEPVKNFYVGKDHVGDVPLTKKILAALTTGALGITVANPTDLVKVRLQAEGRLPPGVPRRYSGALNAYSTIARQEGVKALWTGIGPNIARNAIINAAELASYDQVKQLPVSKCSFFVFSNVYLPMQTILKIPGFTDNVVTHLLSGLGAGFFAVCIGSPVDVVKSRMMGDSAYKSTLDCFIKTLKNDGPMAFYKGFIPNFGRLGSWNVIMFLTLEQSHLKELKKNQNPTKQGIEGGTAIEIEDLQ